MKGYMESGEFSRGKESIRAYGGIVMVGNFDVDVQHQQRVGHLFGPLPPEMRDDTAFMDRIHAYLPGWDVPKMDRELFTDHFGLVSDFLSECWSRLREQSRLPAIQGRVFYGGALSGRDTNAVNKTVSGLLKLLYPDRRRRFPTGTLSGRCASRWSAGGASRSSRSASARWSSGNTQFSFVLGDGRAEEVVETAELAADGYDHEPQAAPLRRPATSVRTTETPGGAIPPHLEPDLSPEALREMISNGESTHVEFKSSLRWDVREGVDNPGLQKGVTRSIAAFLNTRGGRLLVGIADDGTVVGIEPDITSLETMRLGAGGRDGFLQALANAVTQHLGAQAAALIRTQIMELDGHQVCVISVGRSPEPVYLHESKEKEEVFVRLESTTRPLGLRETTAYIRANWG